MRTWLDLIRLHDKVFMRRRWPLNRRRRICQHILNLALVVLTIPAVKAAKE